MLASNDSAFQVIDPYMDSKGRIFDRNLRVGGMMSKRRGIWAVRSPLSAARGWCKSAADRVWQFAGSTMDGLQENHGRSKNVGQAFHGDFGSESVELKEFARTLKIGDRFRVLSDDGVLLAEKISQKQFKLLVNRDPLQFR